MAKKITKAEQLKRDVFAALPRKGAAKAQALSKKLDVAYAKVCKALDTLVDDGGTVTRISHGLLTTYARTPETFELQVLLVLPPSDMPEAMKAIADNLGLLTRQGDRTFVSSVAGSKIRKALAPLVESGKALRTGKLSTTRYAKA